MRTRWASASTQLCSGPIPKCLSGWAGRCFKSPEGAWGRIVHEEHAKRNRLGGAEEDNCMARQLKRALYMFQAARLVHLGTTHIQECPNTNIE